MATPAQETDAEIAVRRLDAVEERAFFDRSARALLGISGDEFVRRWNAGEYDDVADDPAHWDVLYLAMLGAVGR